MKRKGFTLIELLVVIAIIGLLAGAISVSFTSARKKARDSRRVSDIKAINAALALYYDTNNAYPASQTDLYTSGKGKLSPTYIATVPKDPKDDDQYNYTSDGAITFSLTTDQLESYKNTSDDVFGCTEAGCSFQ